MTRRRGSTAVLAVVLVLALGGLPGLGIVARALQTGEIFSPASGHAQVIAQGIASLPAEGVWRTVFHSIEPGDDAEFPAGGPGFFLVDTGGVLLDGAGEPVLLAPSEASFHSEDPIRLTPLGERSAGLFAIDVVPPEMAEEIGDGIPVFASEPFIAPAGPRDLDLVRDLLEPGEATTVIGNEAPVLVLVTLGAVQVEATDGSSSALRVGEAATFSGDVVITAEGQAPSTFVAAVIGREAPVAFTGMPGATPVAAATGSVQLTVYACPPLVSPAEASPGTCLREAEAVALTLAAIDGPELRDVGPSRERQGLPTWSGLPTGDYALQATSFGEGFGRFFVPGLEGLSPGGENGYPAGIRGGYRIPIGGDTAEYALDVYVFVPGSEGSPTPEPAATPRVTATPPVTGATGPTEIPSIFEIEPADPDATVTPVPAPVTTATPRATARPIVTSTAVAQPRLGSIEARVFGCLNPIETFDPANCAQALDSYNIRLIDEDGEIIGLDQATVNDDGSVTWEDLPLGSYLVQQPVLLPGATTYFVPDLPLNEDNSGYLVTIDRETPVAAVNIYSLPPSTPPTVTPAEPADTDGDGLPNADENGIYGTDPANADSDFDGVGDGAEIAAGSDPLTSDTAPPPTGDGDSDGDRLSDGDEAAFGTDPGNPDSDGDGYYDGDEINLGTDPLNAASVP